MPRERRIFPTAEETMRTIAHFAAAAAFVIILASCAGSLSGRARAFEGRGDLLEIEDLPVLRAALQTRQFCTYDWVDSAI
jgi:hypothetical protein